MSGLQPADPDAGAPFHEDPTDGPHISDSAGERTRAAADAGGPPAFSAIARFPPPARDRGRRSTSSDRVESERGFGAPPKPTHRRPVVQFG